ncbi:hypothetical protein C2S52_014576 [Perilla frutescens var. hirtella]|nr:hypothetical protein C2S52_014576 [Perilla frutescens var. hirtella]
METTYQTRLTILMFPWLAHGHIFPYLELAQNLSKHNFQIYYCSTPINLKSIKTILATTSTVGVPIRLIELHLPSSPELPPDFHTTKNTPPNLMPKLHEAFHQSKSEFTTIISSLKPDLLIYDCFQPWAASIASSLRIPAVHFAVSAAAVHAYYYHLYTRRDSSPFPYDAIYLRGYEEKAFKRTIVAKKIEDDDQDRGFAHYTLSQEIVLIKTCRSLEDKYIDYLSLLSQKKQIIVGSLITPTTNDDDDSSNHSMIMQWLSSKKRFSTVFISVGSENYLSKNQMREIAKGLEISDVNFIWVVRFPRGERGEREEALPEGFLERTRERGVIVEWAPQDKILAHSNIGAFVSHCGWNSTLESIHFGVPVIGIPFKIDQPLNAKLMVEVGVAVEVVRDENGDFSCEEFADAINKVVVGKNGEEMREKAAELSEKMRSEEETAISEAARLLRRICIERMQQN